MNRVFVYETLKHKKIIEEALGESSPPPEHKAALSGYIETQIGYKGETWPTLKKTGNPQDKLPGDVFSVSNKELKKLDNWEDHYTRIRLPVGLIRAWVYVIKDEIKGEAKDKTDT